MFHAKLFDSFGFMGYFKFVDFHTFNFITEKISAAWEFKYEKKAVDQFKSKGGKKPLMNLVEDGKGVRVNFHLVWNFPTWKTISSLLQLRKKWT